MSAPKMGEGVVVGKNVHFGKGVVIWNFVVIGDNARIGDRTRIGSFCDVGKDVTIGKNCNIQTHVTISNACRLGDNVFMAPNSTVLNDKFPVSEPLSPSTIKDNVIIGGGSVILPNVTVNEDAVVAAASVVTRDVAKGMVVKGMPAKPTMTRAEYEAKKKVFTKRS
jgi:UDP-2-acetamido-3-amino-2,3-dideoxy-glucuronate N-acetyltransferase